MNASNKEVRQNIKYGVILVVPFILWMLPANFFDTGQSICLSKLIMERDCPGCGMTRAVQHAMHGEFTLAFGFNKVIIVIMPLFIFIYLRLVRDTIRRLKTRFNSNQ
jgi:hypothetical protein